MDQPESSLQTLLNRPLDQRVREFQYRFAQASVFGLPVIGLQLFGRSLGGADAPRWVAILQMLLSGWIVYVGAAGIFFEGMILLTTSRRLTAGLVVALLAIGGYLVSAASAITLLVTGRFWFEPLLFHWVVLMLIAWNGVQWWWLAHRPHD